MIFVMLTGIVIAACVFVALLWSIYRAVQTKGKLRAAYMVLAVSTLLVATAITYDMAALLLSAGLTCAATAIVAITVEPRWTKLLPMVQVILGGLSIYVGASLTLS